MSISTTLQDVLKADANLSQFYEEFDTADWRTLKNAVTDMVSQSDKFHPSRVVEAALHDDRGRDIMETIVKRLNGSQKREFRAGNAEALALCKAAIRHLAVSGPSIEFCLDLLRQSFDTEVDSDFTDSIGWAFGHVKAKAQKVPGLAEIPSNVEGDDAVDSVDAVSKLRQIASQALQRQGQCYQTGIAYGAGRTTLFELAQVLVESPYLHIATAEMNFLEDFLSSASDGGFIEGAADGAPVESTDEVQCPLLVRQSRGVGMKCDYSQQRIALQYLLEVRHLNKENTQCLSSK